jgi:hypothetical protein
MNSSSFGPQWQMDVFCGPQTDLGVDAFPGENGEGFPCDLPSSSFVQHQVKPHPCREDARFVSTSAIETVVRLLGPLMW